MSFLQMFSLHSAGSSEQKKRRANKEMGDENKDMGDENPLLKLLGLGQNANWTLEGCCWRIATMYFHPRLQTILGKSLWSSRQTILTKTPPQVDVSGVVFHGVNWISVCADFNSRWVLFRTTRSVVGFKAGQAHHRPSISALEEITRT